MSANHEGRRDGPASPTTSTSAQSHFPTAPPPPPWLIPSSAPASHPNPTHLPLGSQEADHNNPKVASITVLDFGRIYRNVTPNVLPLSTRRGSHFKKFGQNQEQWSGPPPRTSAVSPMRLSTYCSCCRLMAMNILDMLPAARSEGVGAITINGRLCFEWMAHQQEC